MRTAPLHSRCGTVAPLSPLLSPFSGLLLAAVIFLSGCVSNYYDIELTPDGETLHRKLTTWRSSTSRDGQQLTTAEQTELDHLARIYSVEAPIAGEQKYHFSGSFAGKTPDDVGGAGSLTVWTSRLGRTSLYIERFRGSNDLNASLRKRHDAANELTDALLVWFDGELGDTDEGVAIRTFLQSRLRDDLKNVATWLWVARAVDDAAQTHDSEQTNRCELTNGAGHEVLAGLMQFLIERGYATPDDLPTIMRIQSGTDPVAPLEFARRMLAKQAGVDAAALTFLSDPESVQTSINTHLADFPAALRYLQETGDTSKKPTEYLTSLVIRIVAPTLFAGGDQVDVALNCPVEPFRTNGRWSGEDRRVTWSEHVAPRNDEPHNVLPALLYAVWSEPDEAYQREHFGRVILTGEPLGEYCLWRNSLDEQQAGEWDTFVQSLRPDDNSREKIAKFRFSTDPPGEAAEATAAQPGRDLLLSALAGEARADGK